MNEIYNIDYSRWHELLDLRRTRNLSEDEQKEYSQYEKVIRELDKEEADRNRPKVEELLKQHEESIKGIKKFVNDLNKYLKQNPN